MSAGLLEVLVECAAQLGQTPDLAAFGKAMANGYPLSAVVGKRALMEAARKTWISSTLASESTALAAAGAVLDWHEQADISGSLAARKRASKSSVLSGRASINDPVSVG